jgi:hypothetical protein
MPDPAAAPGAAPTNPEAGKAAGSAVPPTATREGDAPVTQKEFTESLDKLRNALFAEQRRALEKLVPTEPKKPDDPPQPGDDGSLKEQFQKFRAERDRKEAEQEREKAELARERRDNALDAAITALKLGDDDLKFFKAFVEQEYGARIKVEGRQVFFEAEDLSRKTVKELVAETFKTHGKRFQPAQSLPGGTGLGSSPGASGAGGTHPWSAMKYDELMKRAQTDPAQFKKYFLEHRQEFEQQRAAAAHG